MPPKAKSKKKEETKDAGASATPPEKPLPTEREIQLKKQLDNLTEELSSMRKQVEELRHENEFLQHEAQQIRVETHEYLAYMSKKTQKRENAVISLSDRNAEQVKEIEAKTEEMVANYEKKKEELKKIILEKETELSGIKKEIEDMHEFQVLKDQQESEIARLEKAVSDMRIKHNEAVQKLKAGFLEEKKKFEEESEDKLKELSKKARKEAYQYLQEHTNKIRLENRKLRRQLVDLIQQSRAMHERKLELEEERKILLREREYADKLSKIKKDRVDKLYKAYGITKEEFKENEDDLPCINNLNLDDEEDYVLKAET